MAKVMLSVVSVRKYDIKWPKSIYIPEYYALDHKSIHIREFMNELYISQNSSLLKNKFI